MAEPLSRPAPVVKGARVIEALAVGGVLALAAALRFYHLAVQSLWNDEGTSVALAGRSLSRITLSAAADIHPPLYHYLLHFWLPLFGTSEAAARSLSAVLGVVLVGLMYLLGRRLFGPLAGWVAALLGAISSYQVYYSQEARMYMLLTALGAASSYFFYLAWLAQQERRRWGAVVGWAVTALLAVYTQYLAVAVIAAQDVAWVAVAVHDLLRGRLDRRQLLSAALSWAGAHALVGALYLPWIWLTWAQLHRWPAVSAPFSLGGLLRQALPLFALGPTVDAGALKWLVAAVLGLALLGVALPDRPGEESGHGRLLALLHWMVPLGLIYYVSLSRPVYHPKFLVQATPGLYLLLGRGVARLAPQPSPYGGGARARLQVGLACLAGLLAVGASLPGLRGYYFDPQYARDDYRGIAEYIGALGRPGDVVLINAPSQIETVSYYYPGPLEMVPLPRKRPPNRKETVRELEQLTASARRIFGIFWATDESDPDRIVEGWLDNNAYKALDAWYGKVRLVIYAVPVKGMAEAVQHPLNVNLGGKVRLQGYSLADAEVTAGDILELSLYWKAINVIPHRYKVFTHVIDDAGHVVGQRDAEPGGGTNYTDTWQEGQEVTDRYGLPILPGTAPGEYLVEVGMYNPDDGTRLPVVEGGEARTDQVILQKVRVVRPEAAPPLAALDMQTRHAVAGEGIAMLGFSFGRPGATDQGLTAFRPGEVAELVAFWQAGGASRGDADVLLRVVDRGGRVCLERRAPPLEGRYPLARWRRGEIVREPISLRLPSDLPTGSYRLLMGWVSGPVPESPQLSELTRFVVE